MQHLEFRFPSPPSAFEGPGWAIAGVVGSGNLEVLVEKGDDPAAAQISVDTSIPGFEEVWERVLDDFVAATPAAGGTAVTINDMGAVPAVVKIRLHQAFARFGGSAGVGADG